MTEFNAMNYNTFAEYVKGADAAGIAPNHRFDEKSWNDFKDFEAELAVLKCKANHMAHANESKGINTCAIVDKNKLPWFVGNI